MLITALHEACKADVIDNLCSILMSPITPSQPNTQHTTQHQILSAWYSGYLKERHSQVHIAAASNKWLPKGDFTGERESSAVLVEWQSERLELCSCPIATTIAYSDTE